MSRWRFIAALWVVALAFVGCIVLFGCSTNCARTASGVACGPYLGVPWLPG